MEESAVEDDFAEYLDDNFFSFILFNCIYVLKVKFWPYVAMLDIGELVVSKLAIH